MFLNRILRGAVAAAAIASITTSAASAYSGLDFRIHNTTDHRIVGFFFRAADGEDSWHAVNGDQIDPGGTTTVSVSGNYSTCEYELKAHLSDGTYETATTNLCTTFDVYV